MLVVSSAFALSRPSTTSLDLASKSLAYRAVAERFVAAAAARDADALEKMLSPALAARAGKAGLQKVLAGQLFPFFADHMEIGRRVTTAETTDSDGKPGFDYYMYSVTKSGQPKPFVIYMVEENGAKVIVNILVNRFVEGRHQ